LERRQISTADFVIVDGIDRSPKSLSPGGRLAIKPEARRSIVGADTDLDNQESMFTQAASGRVTPQPVEKSLAVLK
jgi:hypothetical protein